MTRSSMRLLLDARRRFDRTESLVGGWRVTMRRSLDVPHRAWPPVVLIPGLGLTGRYLLPVAAELAQRFPVWITDVPGFGRNEGPALDVPALGRWVVSWMDHVGLDRAVLMGNSMGCQTAVEAAVQHPERVAAIVLQGPTMDAEARSVLRHIPRLAVGSTREPRSLTPVQVVDWLATGPRRMAAGVRHGFSHAVEERARGVRCPALVVCGSRDAIVPQRWAEQLTRALPDGKLRMVPGATHLMTYRDPLELTRVTTPFLTALGPSEGR